MTAYVTTDDLLVLVEELGGLRVRDLGLPDSAAHRSPQVHRPPADPHWLAHCDSDTTRAGPGWLTGMVGVLNRWSTRHGLGLASQLRGLGSTRATRNAVARAIGGLVKWREWLAVG